MKFKPILLAFVAMITGLVVAVSVGRKPGDSIPEADGPTVRTILVATVDIDTGTPMGPQAVRLETRPVDGLPKETFRSIHDLQSRFALVRIAIGEPVTMQNTTESATKALNSVPSGYRMCMIHTSLTPSLQSILEPGSLVDVLVYLPQSVTVPVSVTRRVATAARVHRCELEDNPLDAASEAKGLVPCVVTLVVKQPEVQPLLLGAENGLFRLTLVGDSTDADNQQDDFTYQQLVSRLPVRGNPSLEIRDQGRQQDMASDEADPERVAEQIEAAVEQAVAEALIQYRESEKTTVQSDTKPQQRMDIFTPTGVTRYVWKTPESAPVVMVGDHQPEAINHLQTTWERIETALRDNEQAGPRK
jgi:Flp pilus assembly protein CpaB